MGREAGERTAPGHEKKERYREFLPNKNKIKLSVEETEERIRQPDRNVTGKEAK